MTIKVKLYARDEDGYRGRVKVHGPSKGGTPKEYDFPEGPDGLVAFAEWLRRRLPENLRRGLHSARIRFNQDYDPSSRPEYLKRPVEDGQTR